MGLHIENICIDSTSPRETAEFWAAALQWDMAQGDGGESDDDEVALAPPAGSDGPGAFCELLFLRVPERKAGKNRLHLCLRPQDQDAEVSRLEALGARRVDVGQGSEVGWVVMADPEGNEFCVLRTP